MLWNVKNLHKILLGTISQLFVLWVLSSRKNARMKFDLNMKMLLGEISISCCTTIVFYARLKVIFQNLPSFSEVNKFKDTRIYLIQSFSNNVSQCLIQLHIWFWFIIFNSCQFWNEFHNFFSTVIFVNGSWVLREGIYMPFKYFNHHQMFSRNYLL